MSAEENKQLVRRIFEELINQENKAVIDEAFASDVVVHDPFRGTTTGIDTFRELLGVFDAAFPGHRVRLNALFAEGEYVSVLHTHTAKHTGEFMGLPPTGKEIEVDGVEIFRVTDGRIVEFWRHDNDFGLMQQLGAIPAPESISA